MQNTKLNISDIANHFHFLQESGTKDTKLLSIFIDTFAESEDREYFKTLIRYWV